MLQRKRLPRNTTPKLARAFKSITKESRLKDYRRALENRLQDSRLSLQRETARLQVIGRALYGLTASDCDDKVALLGLVMAMERHTDAIDKARVEYFKTLEKLEFSDTELWEHWQGEREAAGAEVQQ